MKPYGNVNWKEYLDYELCTVMSVYNELYQLQDDI
jgi:hypothetical protein